MPQLQSSPRSPQSPLSKRGLNLLGSGIALGVLAVPLLIYGLALQRRPPANSQPSQPLFQGINYERIVLKTPRPQIIHRLQLDLTTAGLIPWSTPPIAVTAPQLAPTKEFNPQDPQATHERRETIAQKTTTALTKNKLQLAINANYFFPFIEDAPWKTVPDEGEPTSLVGTAIAQGQLVSPPQQNWPAICFLQPQSAAQSSAQSAAQSSAQSAAQSAAEQRAVISASGQCPQGTQTAVAGNQLLMDNGQPGNIQDQNPTKPYPMVIAALDDTGQQLQLILIDGKQPFYSEGITLTEAIALLQSWGIHSAIRLDGGGSTSLAIEGPQGKPQLLNAVIQAKVPGRERPVANHLGFYANPLSEQSSQAASTSSLAQP